jgi:hypothetical protein
MCYSMFMCHSMFRMACTADVRLCLDISLNASNKSTAPAVSYCTRVILPVSIVCSSVGSNINDCTYMWSNNGAVISEGQPLVLDETATHGRYDCNRRCIVRNKICYIFVKCLFVEQPIGEKL